MRESTYLTMVAFVFVAILVALILPAIRQTRCGPTPRNWSKNNLKQLVIAFHNYHDQHAGLPVGTLYGQDHTPLHGWQTLLLPQIEQSLLYEEIDLNSPWNATANAEHFRQRIDVYQNPQFDEQFDEDGFALTHYAANVHVVSSRRRLRFETVSDGMGNTILAGEIAAGFPAWGDPFNWREPGLGINRSPRGFGSPFEGGAHVVFLDGHVRFVSEDADPEVLRALGTPDGGEMVDADSL